MQKRNLKKVILTLFVATIMGGGIAADTFAVGVATNAIAPVVMPKQVARVDAMATKAIANKDVAHDRVENTDDDNVDATASIATISKKDLHKLAVVIAEIKKNYVRKVTDHELIDNAISGMLYGLDPHSEYLKKNDLEVLSAITLGKFGGIGIEVIPYQGLIKVISPLDGTPAAKAGIKAGDIVVQINNKLIKDMQLHDALRMMRGPKGSKVTLTISRKSSSKPLIFKLVRDIVKVKAVREQLFEDNIGYVRIAFFQESTNADVIRAINKLKQLLKYTSSSGSGGATGAESGGVLRGLILDLRNNPGGLLDAAVQVVNNFLDVKKTDRNNIIVYTKGGSEHSQITARATPGELLPGVPMVILVNEGSASAAEVVAGALQDYKRAVIVGTKSFGKGSVQALLPLGRDSAIKLTTALYYTPLGRSIQAKGIDPDIVITELKISEKGVIDDSSGARLDESSLLDHLQNGNDVQEDGKDKKDVVGVDDSELKDRDVPEKYSIDKSEDKDDSSKIKSRSALLYKDYQLYEAINVLRGLAVVKMK